MKVGADGKKASFFQRFLLPGFAFKGFVIGGGYATGRELAEFFLVSGPWGGLAGMVLAMVLWSLICAATFAFAQAFQTFDYRSFFAVLLGRGWIVFEFAYVLFIILVVAVFGAAAGEIGAAMFGFPVMVGTIALALSIIAATALGNTSVERLFKFATPFIYFVYAIFMILAFTSFGERITDHFSLSTSAGNWALGGLTYASYNVVGAIVILPLLRHLTSRRDAVVAGLVAGPLAMWPAIVFFICMIAFYPGIEAETLPSNFMLEKLNSPLFQIAFQFMIFTALLESGVGAIHSINERVDHVLMTRRDIRLGTGARIAIAAMILIGCIFVADRFGLIALIASGYTALAYIFIGVYILPLMTIGIVKLYKNAATLSARPAADHHNLSAD